MDSNTMLYINSVISGLVTLAVTILALYFKNINSRQNSMENRQNQLEKAFREVDKDFVRHNEFNRDINRIEANLSSIHQRLDKLIETVNDNQQQVLMILNKKIKE